MQYIIGTDEAGYGPNLGPLIVSATLWAIPDECQADQLQQRLQPAIVPTLKEVAQDRSARLAMADSKKLYTRGKGLQHLERGLGAAMSVLGQQPETWLDVWKVLASSSETALQPIPWYDQYDEKAPIDANAETVATLGQVLAETLDKADVQLLDVQSQAVLPEQFNEVTAQHGSKGATLSHTTLDLIARLMRPLDDAPILVICDKHGGRNRYAPLLGEHFPDSLIEIHGEGRHQSAYRFGPPERRVEFRFQTKGERFLPAALASMASKYLRELAMRAFNSFWCSKIENLRPTAGYPQDAKRFKAAIAAVQAELNIPDRILWRTK